MRIVMDKLCRVFSRAMDIIEEEQLGASEHHGMRVAALCAAMGKRLGYDEDTKLSLAVCALFHDNALTEFPLSETELAQNGKNMILHCEQGQKNVSRLPLKKDPGGYILYHHERENGEGPFSKRAGEFPFEAALLAAADTIDVKYRLQHIKPAELPALRENIAAVSDSFSTREAVEVLLETLDSNMLESLRDENVGKTLNQYMPSWEVNINEACVTCLADFISHVIDNKSIFTRKHTSQIANRAWLMATHYGYTKEEKDALYLAASLHDIGKMATPIGILEKPGKLSKDEFKIIKTHVKSTYDWLSEIPGFGLMRDWAAFHHEKLDGSGYPFGKKGIELDFNARLIACLDIYQAAGEKRPYHDARSHEETMLILYEMAGNSSIDSNIVKDIDTIMKQFSMKDAPAPKSIENA